MTSKDMRSDMALLVDAHLPYLRRYARALTGSQEAGDGSALATLEALIDDPKALAGFSSPQIGLFATFHRIWDRAGAPVQPGETGLKARAQEHMAGLGRNTREALLLSTVEGFSNAQVGEIIGLDPAAVADLLAEARAQMEASIRGTVLIIEDEAVISMELEAIVQDMGHTVSGVLRTRDDARALDMANPPNLILSDIQLADDSSGIDAVADLTERFGARPVVFITAYPERLLTGQSREPAFLITKPYTADQVKSAVSQAMFFASTETLRS